MSVCLKIIHPPTTILGKFFRRGLQYEGGPRRDQPDSMLTSRDITLPTKVHVVKAMVFPVVMYGCESWTIKKLSAKELMLLNCGGVGEDS